MHVNRYTTFELQCLSPYLTFLLLFLVLNHAINMHHFTGDLCSFFFLFVFLQEEEQVLTIDSRSNDFHSHTSSFSISKSRQNYQPILLLLFFYYYNLSIKKEDL